MTNTKGVYLGGRLVGESAPPFVVAEMSGNHNRSLDRALAIVQAAADCGAHAIKLQTYTADTITMNVDREEFYIRSKDSPWAGRHLYELLEQAYTPWEWHESLFRRARELGLVAFSTPFDETAVDYLEELGVPCYKIGSFENNHLPLIRKVASTGKPMVISTGMASLAELDEVVRAARDGGCSELVLLKCTSNYPATPESSNLVTIPHLRELFDCQVGLSDHTLGIGAAVASIALGATFIEKHLTLSRVEGGVDADFSLEPHEMKNLVYETERAWQALGSIYYGPTKAEGGSLAFRRSLYIAEDMNAGDILTPDNLRVVRPGLGLAPKYYDLLLGRKVNQNLKKGTATSWDILA